MKTRATHPELFAELDGATALAFASSLANSDSIGDSDVDLFRNANMYHYENKMQNLHLAAYLGYGEIVKLLLENAPIDYVNTAYTKGVGARGITPLFAAIMGFPPRNKTPLEAEIQKLAIMQTLIDHGANVNHQLFDDKMPLHIAATKGLNLITGYLIQNGALVNVQDKNGDTPIHLVVKQPFSDSGLKILETLCVHDAYLESSNNEQKTPLFIAAEENNFDYVTALLRYGANPKLPNTNDSFININPEAAIKLFRDLFHKANTQDEKKILQETLLASSIETRQEFFRLILLEFYRNMQAIAQAKSGNMPVNDIFIKQSELGMIIEAIADENLIAEFSDVFFNIIDSKRLKAEDKQMLLQLVINPDEVNLGVDFLQEKINTDKNTDKIHHAMKAITREFSQRYPLHAAVIDSQPQLFKDIIKKQPDALNQKRASDNHTALSLAVDLKQWPSVVKLLELGASYHLPTITHEENISTTILHLAIQDAADNSLDMQTFDTLLSILEKSGDLSFMLLDKDSLQGNAYLLAANLGNPLIIKKLLHHGGSQEEIIYAEIMANRGDMLAETLSSAAKINLDKMRSHLDEDKSFLQIAIARNQLDAINLLLLHGANINKQDLNGNSTLHQAIVENHPIVLNFLLDKGANVMQENARGRTFLEEAMFKGINLSETVKSIDTKMLFSALSKKSVDRAKPSLLKHAFNYCSKQHDQFNAKPVISTFTDIARLNPEGFYKEFKMVSADLRKAANNRKLSLEAKLEILKQHKNLCETVFQVAPKLLKRKVLYTNFFFKENLKDLLLKEQGKLAKKIDVLGKKIEKVNREEMQHGRGKRNRI